MKFKWVLNYGILNIEFKKEFEYLNSNRIQIQKLEYRKFKWNLNIEFEYREFKQDSNIEFEYQIEKELEFEFRIQIKVRFEFESSRVNWS